jgi:hypothetical protein
MKDDSKVTHCPDLDPRGHYTWIEKRAGRTQKEIQDTNPGVEHSSPSEVVHPLDLEEAVRT